MTKRIYPDLVTFFKATKTRQGAFAARLSISGAYMSRIKNGLAQPPLDLALRIADEANIPLDSLVSEKNS